MVSEKMYKNIDEYISFFHDQIRQILESLREAIQQAAPEAEEAINYQIPTFKLNGKNLVHFACYKNHIGFYPTPSAIKAFQKELLQWESAKGSVKFPISEPLPYDLIQKIVKFRVKENMKY